MMVRLRKNNIIMTHGDTLDVVLSLVDRCGKKYVPATGDTIRFALKKEYSDIDPIMVKNIPIDTMRLRIESTETKELEQPGVYVYDIQLTMADGTVDTVIPKGRLVIEEEVA